MSDEKTTTEEQQETEAKVPASDAEAEKTVKKGTVIILALILFSLVWYLLADRFTPYTQQARVQGYVVGVAPKVAGLVTEVWVKNNQKVEKGQRLFQIDVSQYEIALKRAQSDLENAQRQVGAGTAGIESAQANLRAALANQLKAQQDITRLERLHRDDPGTISVRRLEVSRATLEQATAKVSQAEAEIQRAIEQRGGDEDDNANLKAALTAVEKAKLDLNNTTVVASTRGIITDLRAEVGQYAGTGSPVMTLIAIDDVWINAEFTENNIGHMKVDTPVDYVLDSIPGKVFHGKVRSLGLGVSSGQPPPAGTLPTIDNNRDWLRQSQRFPVIISLQLDQPDQLEQIKDNLRIGGQAEVIAYTEGHGILKLLGKIYIRFMSWLSYAY
jgi:multidrug resistance efflux pump